MFFSACTACAYGSPTPTRRPDSSVAVVPETHTKGPTRTALEYPTIGSQGVPVAKVVRFISTILGLPLDSPCSGA